VLLASGTSDRQSRSVASELEDLAKTYGLVRLHSTRDEASTWTLVDFASVVAHIFEPSRRAYYDLEDLWPDAHPTPPRGGEAPDPLRKWVTA